MKKTILILSILVIGFLTILILYLKPTSSKTENSDTHAISDQNTNKRSNLNTLSTSSSQQPQPLAFEILHALSPDELAKIRIPEYFQEKNTNNPIYFSFDHNKIEQLKVGEQFDLHLPESDIEQIAIIKEIEPLEDDIVRISGTFQGSPEDINYFSITHTKSDQYAVMKVFTEDGDYIIEIKDGIGMLNTGPINHHGNDHNTKNEATPIDD